MIEHDSTNISTSPLIELNFLLDWIELNYFVIEYFGKILNWIIFWIEFSWNSFELNHFLAKFKYWIESIWVSDSSTQASGYKYAHHAEKI